ncbi:DNA recombination protein RmuC [bacterium]|nr:MAG: DNA recombination protein RmuC [bacterium]
MDFVSLLGAAIGLVFGFVLTWLWSRSHVAALEGRLVAEREALVRERDEARAHVQRREQELGEARAAGAAVSERLAAVEGGIKAEREGVERERMTVERLKEELSAAFAALSAAALDRNSGRFLQLAGETLAKVNETAKGELELRQQAISELVKPVRESLEKVDAKIQELETKRAGAYAGLSKQVEGLAEAQQRLQTEAATLRSETSGLRAALRNPTVRGRWGEIQLRRVVELAGMLEHCDFEEQRVTQALDRRDRPDLTVKLPGNKVIFVDAKAPLQAYLDAVEATDESVREQNLRLHAKQLREHVIALGKRAYAHHDGRAPDFVFMFVPGEAFFSAALEQDPTLIETGVDQRVFIASPTSLIAMLRAVAYSWDQRQLEDNAREIGKLGSELYERLRRVGGFLAKVGDNLESTVKSYNDAVGSLEARLLPSARKFYAKLGTGAGDELKPLRSVDTAVRELRSAELDEDTGEGEARLPLGPA